MKMAALDIAYIVVEGRLQFTRDGVLMGKWAGQGGDRRPWTRGNVRRLLWSCRLQGVNIDFTDGIDDTVEWLLAFEQWTSKTSHKSLKVRAGPVNMWGTPGSRDFQRHLIMGFDGIGAELAERILDTLGMPFELRVTRKELLTVEGLGPKKADAIIAALTRGEANG
jgi:ERCC4-type nuclease